MVADRSRTRNSLIKGRPIKYIVGHHGRFVKIIPQTEEAAPFKIDGVYCRLIPLSGGYHTIVCESDYLWLMQWKWYARRSGEKQVTAVRVERCKVIFMHRLILGLDSDCDLDPDHENGVPLDNRRGNLRDATHAQNMWNKGRRSDNTSGYKGVNWHVRKQAWQARISANGVRHHLGYFSTKEAAYAAYCEAAKFYHGEFARVA